MEKKEWSPDELRHKAEAYCAAAERCEYDVRLKLKQWNVDAKTAGEIVDFLYDHNFLSVERYCQAFVHDKLLFQGWGRVKIEYMLRARRLSAAAIQNALKTIDETEYFRVLSRLISSRKDSGIKNAKEAQNNLFRFLLQRGFSADEIRQALAE